MKEHAVLLEDIVSIIIIIICLLGGYGIKRSSGTLIAGFELLPENRRQRLKENGFVKKRSRLSFIIYTVFYLFGDKIFCKKLSHDRMFIYHSNNFFFANFTGRINIDEIFC